MKEHDFMKMLGNNIRTFRTQAGLTQGELAKQIGRSVASISKYERGDCAVDSYTLCNIAASLGVSAYQLLPEQTPVSAGDHTGRQWSIISRYSRFYLYNIGFISRQLCCSQIEINWEDGTASMSVDMGRAPKGFSQTNMILHGNVYATSACTNIRVTNPVAPIDYYHIVINSADWYAGKQICHVSYSTVNWRSVAAKGVLMTKPECPPNIDELLSFTKEDLREIRNRHLVLF